MTARNLNDSDALIIVVDDDAWIRRALERLLLTRGYQVTTLASGAELLTVALPERSCVVLDYQMPVMNGVETLDALRRAGHQVPVILMTAHGHLMSRQQAMESGATDLLLKPFEDSDLLAAIETGLASRGLS